MAGRTKSHSTCFAFKRVRLTTTPGRFQVGSFFRVYHERCAIHRTKPEEVVSAA